MLRLLPAVLLASGTLVASKFYYGPAQTVLTRPLAHDTDILIQRIEALSVVDDDPVRIMKALQPESAAELDEPRLLQVLGSSERRWATEGEKLRLRKEGIKFADVTDFQDLDGARLKPVQDDVYPELKHQSKVRDVISELKVQNMHDQLTTLTSFYNRFYKSDYGAQSAHYIYLQVLDIIANAPPSVPLSLHKHTHPFAQPSILARFEPPRANASLPAVILGAHQDSANYRLPLLPAPGADDDGSGSVTILEAFRALVKKGFRPAVPVEFHWYAGEEGGLLGSQHVVKEAFVDLGREVRGMMQFDMVAYTKKGVTPRVTLIDTDVTPSLTNWTLKLAKEYADIPVQTASLFPGAGSDHMSFYRAGYSSCFGIEADPFTAIDPYVHTVNDTMDLPDGEFSLDHALEFAKVAVGFAVELGGWVSD